MQNVHFEALLVGFQHEAIIVTAVVPDGANGHSNVVQSDVFHCALFFKMAIMVNGRSNVVQSGIECIPFAHCSSK